MLAELSKSMKMYEMREVPYAQAIQALGKLDLMRSPLHKIKTILKTASLINSCLNKFLERTDKKVELDGDHLFSIINYVLVRSGVSSIMAHLKFIEAFTTTNIMDSVSGYYCTNFEAASNYLGSLVTSPKKDV
eukprot:TRINITY_DN12060_c0_g1_i1.p1 TRINITY_DN12060_c0_g1~~TRINITY_DN12060_c0_g1_i1.p1  ORF type:complete len:133 (-),score=17.43 TRINITY_DN12060_c0_g1_i1:151-549(-)